VSNDEPSETKTVRQTMPIDGKFVELNVYNEFIKNNKIQIEGINLRIDELRKLIDDILLELKKKVDAKDLKNLEG
jgi:hypothetical protein